MQPKQQLCNFEPLEFVIPKGSFRIVTSFQHNSLGCTTSIQKHWHGPNQNGITTVYKSLRDNAVDDVSFGKPLLASQGYTCSTLDFLIRKCLILHVCLCLDLGIVHQKFYSVGQGTVSLLCCRTHFLIVQHNSVV